MSATTLPGAARHRHHHPEVTHDAGFIAIGVFKLVKAVLLAAAGVAALHLIHGDATAIVSRWLEALSVGTGHRVVQRLLAWVSGLSPRHLEQLGVAAFVYAALLATEGVGLLLGKVWAEYLTVVLTASLIPFELYELARRATAPKALTLAANVAAVAYLVYRLAQRRSAREKRDVVSVE